MAFELMVDNTPIAIRDVEIYTLIDGVLPEHIPMGLFRNGKTEQTINVFEWLRQRAIPENRTDIDDILKILGMDRYDDWGIVKLTGGTLMTDPFWIRFKDDWTYYNHTTRGVFNLNPINPFIPLIEHKE